MARRTSLAVAAALLALRSASALAVPPLASEDFYGYCDTYHLDPADADGLRCAIYIQGFLDGAIATDERVATNVAAEYEQKESFTDRALRTRLGPRYTGQRTAFYAEYCLGDPVPVQEVIARVLAYLQANPPDEGTLARDSVYAALRQEYPCRQ